MSRSPKLYDPAAKYNKVINDKTINVQVNANSVPNFIFIADQSYQVVSIWEVHSSAGGSGAAARVRKVTNASAPNASAGANVVEISSSNADLTLPVNVNNNVPLSTTYTDLQIAPGDKLAVNYSGTLTGLVGELTISLRRI